MTTAAAVKRDLARLADKEKATLLARFFKTGKGEYGEGDRFLGLAVPQQRSVAKLHADLPLAGIRELLRSPYHEHRLTALLILVDRYGRAAKRKDDAEERKIYDFYLVNAARVDNWDLVDLTAPNIVGRFLLGKERDVLYRLVRSRDLWERRIAIVATLAFIRERDLTDTFRLSGLLLGDRHDLIHKATGWMLREAGKRDQAALERFLTKHAARMPRTALRYAIERFPERKRQRYLVRGKKRT